MLKIVFPNSALTKRETIASNNKRKSGSKIKLMWVTNFDEKNSIV